MFEKCITTFYPAAPLHSVHPHNSFTLDGSQVFGWKPCENSLHKFILTRFPKFIYIDNYIRKPWRNLLHKSIITRFPKFIYIDNYIRKPWRNLLHKSIITRFPIFTFSKTQTYPGSNSRSSSLKPSALTTRPWRHHNLTYAFSHSYTYI